MFFYIIKIKRVGDRTWVFSGGGGGGGGANQRTLALARTPFDIFSSFFFSFFIFFSSLDMTGDTSKQYSLMPSSVIVTSIHGHSVAREPELLKSLCCKVLNGLRYNLIYRLTICIY